MGRSKARKQRQPAPLEISVLQKKTADAIARGKFQSGRDWAKELFRRDPTVENRRLLVEATLGRSSELRRSGSAADAALIVQSIADAGFDSQEHTARAACELLLAGDFKTVGPLLGRITEPALLARIQSALADSAVLQGPRGLAKLPADLQSNAQRVLAALNSIAGADDRAATEAVAGIPAESAFFEWRLLVEALAAYYTGRSSDAPWPELSPNRAPAAIMAPFRASQDRAFRDCLPAWQQADARSLIARLTTPPSVSALEDLKRLAAEENMPAAIRRCGDVLKALPDSEGAAIRPRLARALYWAIADSAEPDFIDPYRRTFGPLPEDPNWHRLRAIQAEHDGDGREAQVEWSEYDNDLASGSIVSEPDRNLARSLVWLRIGGIAVRFYSSGIEQLDEDTEDELDYDDGDEGEFDEADDEFDEESEDDDEGEYDDEYDEFEDDIDQGPGRFAGRGYLDDDRSGPRFPAVTCFERSIELAPLNRMAHEFLLDLLESEDATKQLVAAASRMLTSFPDNERALDLLAVDASNRECWDEAMSYQERAVRARPHDELLADRLAFYQFGFARQRAQQGRFDDARAVLNGMLENKTGGHRYEVLCRLAAVEIMAGQLERSDRLFDEACRAAPSRLAAVYRMLVEAIRMPLDQPRRARLAADFRSLIRAKPDAATARELIEGIAAYRHKGSGYEGFPDHEQLVLKYVRRAKRVKWSQADLVVVCKSLLEFEQEKVALDFAQLGMKLFPDDPHFPLCAATYYYSLGPERCPVRKLTACLDTVQRLARGRPEHAELAEAAGRIQRSVEAYTAISRLHDLRGTFDPNTPLPASLFQALQQLLGLPDDDAEED